MKDLIKYGLLAGVAYYVYVNFLSQPAQAIAPVGPVPTIPPVAPAPPPYQYTPPTTLEALKKAILPATTGTADVLNFYYGTIPGKTPLVAGFDEVFFPNGRPAKVEDTPKISPEAYLAGLATKGLSGLGRAIPKHLTTPALASILRASQGRGAALNYVRRGSPMPMGVR